MQKVLIIRFSSIGDIVLTSPLVRTDKAQKPGIQIHYVTKKGLCFHFCSTTRILISFSSAQSFNERPIKAVKKGILHSDRRFA